MTAEEIPTWQQRVDAIWASTTTMSDDDVLAAVTALVDEQPDSDAAAAFELASAYDFVGREVDAEPAYRRAIDLGLDGTVRTRAVIQLSSSLRNLGRAEESRVLLSDELAANPDSTLRDSLVAFLGLTLIDLGEDRAAATLTIGALSTHLLGYRRAVDHYVSVLSAPTEAEEVVEAEAPEAEVEVPEVVAAESEAEQEIDAEEAIDEAEEIIDDVREIGGSADGSWTLADDGLDAVAVEPETPSDAAEISFDDLLSDAAADKS